jgi:prepilin-type N-terminal cleavage/methylation domain-containing protein
LPHARRTATCYREYSAGQSQPRIRAGFTLLEVMLTLTVLAILAAMAWPQLEKPLERHRLHRAAEELRIAFSRTRIEAMTSGTVYAFRHAQSGQDYTIQAWSEIDPQETFAGNMAPPTAQLAASTMLKEGEVSSSLPETMHFVGSEKSLSTRDMSFEPQELTTAQLDQWSSPLFFFPDGTTSSALLEIQDDKGRYVQLELRGLTGICRIVAEGTTGEVTQ